MENKGDRTFALLQTVVVTCSVIAVYSFINLLYLLVSGFKTSPHWTVWLGIGLCIVTSIITYKKETNGRR